MGLYTFHDNTFLEYKGFWFLWEPAWDAYRPIENVVWEGDRFRIVDKLYCADPTDVWYGYGNEKMKTLCSLLASKFATAKPTETSLLPIGKSEWFRDRFATLSPCAPRDLPSWKRLVRGKGRTCRKAPRGNKLTKRNLTKI
jgi:hypothetical protein